MTKIRHRQLALKHLLRKSRHVLPTDRISIVAWLEQEFQNVFAEVEPFPGTGHVPSCHLERNLVQGLGVEGSELHMGAEDREYDIEDLVCDDPAVGEVAMP